MFRKKREEISEETRQVILNRIRPIIANQLDIDETKITLASRIGEDLGADSLDATEIIMALEAEFNIEILDDDVEKMKTIEDIITYLVRVIKA